MNPREIIDVELLQSLLVELVNKQEELEGQLITTQEQLSEALDEINRLKGEQGKPKFASKKAKNRGKQYKKVKQSQKDSQETSSSSDSSTDTPPAVDRIEIVGTPPKDLPLDAEYKGYRTVYQKNIKIVRDNVAYQISRWYSAETGKYYESALPANYNGPTGNMLKSFTQILHHCGDMTHRKIIELLNHLGIKVSTGGISNMLTHSNWVLAEQEALLTQSIGSSPYIQMDSTTSKEKGVRMHTQIICGKYFSLFYTQKGRSRLDVYAALQGQSRDQVSLAYTALSQARLLEAKVSKKHLQYFEKAFSWGDIFSMDQLQFLFDSVDIFEKTNISRRSVIAGALAAGYYHQQNQIPIIESMMSDDAGEYKGVARKNHLHCWIHAIRHYRVLNPKNEYLRTIHDDFMDKLWDFYEEMKSYKELPRKRQLTQKKQIEKDFDELFGEKTDYLSLNKQMALTREKRPFLLAFLQYPDFPLHNNAAERGARRIVRKRNISFHTWSKRGTSIRDAFMSLHQTAKKLNISFLDYLQDRNAGICLSKSLATQGQEAYS